MDDRAVREPLSDAELVELLDRQDWRRLYAQLVKFAFGRTRSADRAADLAQEAIRRVYDANWERWDPREQPDLFRFLTGIVSRLVSNEGKAHRRHRELQVDPDAAVYAGASDPGVDPERRAAAAELYDRRARRLRERLADDAQALAILDLTEAGVDLPLEQAAASGMSPADVSRARKRLAHHAEVAARDVAKDSLS